MLRHAALSTRLIGRLIGRDVPAYRSPLRSA